MDMEPGLILFIILMAIGAILLIIGIAGLFICRRNQDKKGLQYSLRTRVLLVMAIPVGILLLLSPIIALTWAVATI